MSVKADDTVKDLSDTYVLFPIFIGVVPAILALCYTVTLGLYDSCCNSKAPKGNRWYRAFTLVLIAATMILLGINAVSPCSLVLSLPPNVSMMIFVFLRLFTFYVPMPFFLLWMDIKISLHKKEFRIPISTTKSFGGKTNLSCLHVILCYQDEYT